MNIFVAMLQALLGRKKLQEQKPDFSDRMAKYDCANNRKAGKSQGAPSQRMTESQRHNDEVMTSLTNPLNPLSPISIYSDPTPSHSTRSDCDSSSSSYSGSSSHDSGSSSCDSSGSSSSSD